MTSPIAVPATSSGRPNVVAPERAKKLSKRLLKLAERQNGVLRIGQLAEAQAVVAELFGLPDWHALSHQPNALPSAMPTDPSPMSNGSSWHWTTLVQTGNSIALSEIFQALEDRLLPMALPILTDEMNVWALVHKPQDDGTFNVHVGTLAPHALNGNDHPWVTDSMPNALKWPHLRSSIEQVNSQNLKRGFQPSRDTCSWSLSGSIQQGGVEVYSSQGTPGYAEAGPRTSMGMAETWWSLLMNRHEEVTIALRLGSTGGTIMADLAVDTGWTTQEPWQRLQDAVMFTRQFHKALPADRQVYLHQEAWPWPAQPGFPFRLIDARNPGHLLGWETRSSEQTTHMQVIAPASITTRQRWLTAGISDLVKRSKHPVNGILVISKDEEQAMRRAGCSLNALHPQYFYNPFVLPVGARRPDSLHHHLLITGLQELLQLFDSTNGFLSLWLEQAYQAVEKGDYPCVSLGVLQQMLKGEGMRLFENMTSTKGIPLLDLAQQSMNDFANDVLLESPSDLHHAGLVTIVPNNSSSGILGRLGRASLWFTMAMARGMCADQTDVWAIDVEAFPDIKAAQWHQVLVPILREARKNNEVVMVAGEDRMPEPLESFATLSVQDCSALDEKGQPYMKMVLDVVTKSCRKQRHVRWQD